MFPVIVAALLGSVGWGWYTGGHIAARIPATVIRDVDGDTVIARFADGRVEKVRLLGVDTPEVVDPRKPVQCFGHVASAFTKSRLVGRRVMLELDAEPRDKYGRLLAYVIVDGHRFDDELLERGYARFLVIPPNGSHARMLRAARGLSFGRSAGLVGLDGMALSLCQLVPAAPPAPAALPAR